MPDTRLRAGDVVRVRGEKDILATLDENGRLNGLPFMPEMLSYAGREMRVYKVAHKACDTINGGGRHRGLDRTVHLVGARCDGSAHGGCQARCLLFFREEWLERPDGTPLVNDPAPPAWDRQSDTVTTSTLTADARAGIDETGAPVYRCQATELNRASTPLSSYSPGQYLTDVRSGNQRLGTVLRGLLIALFNRYQFQSRKFPRWLRIKDGLPYPFLRGTGPGPAAKPQGLRPGDWVEVRSRDEISATLRPDNTNRGMSFDVEMLPYCGKRYQVDYQVEQIIDERTGKMLKLRDCYVLKDVYCQAVYHRFCPRAIFPYWREAWLRKVAGPDR